ncbi:MAG TPA: hypothetical protein VFD01_13455 [Candidatus Dormibacteraeota bacterium]|nr:hypothetical protein [Candidatus Dormibacteraeota bacterium]
MSATPVPADLLQRLAGQATVGAWLRAYDAHWEVSQTDDEVRSKLEVLSRFCLVCGKEPDELVAWLFRETPEGPRIRLKRRRRVMALIDEFEREHGGRPAGNVVRSFLIHNGVALSAAPLR